MRTINSWWQLWWWIGYKGLFQLDWWLQKKTKLMNSKRGSDLIEIVICSAVKTTDGQIVRGHRHADCFHTIKRMGLKPSLTAEAQGFITSKNRFVGRELGRVLQDKAGIESANKSGYFPKTLFSEDLY